MDSHPTRLFTEQQQKAVAKRHGYAAPTLRKDAPENAVQHVFHNGAPAEYARIKQSKPASANRTAQERQPASTRQRQKP